MINDELIERFFANQCTPEEARQVTRYLEEHPEILEKYLPEEEFLELHNEGDIPEAVSQQWLNNIHQQSNAVRNRTKWIKRLAIAAAAVGLIVLASRLMIKPAQEQPLAGNEPNVVIPQNQQAQQTNNTNKPMAIVLPDGSVVQLLPQAVITYHKLFSENRNIYLTGEADFTVVPDKAHPFTVYSSELHTTVLGTFFHVKALPGEDMISVRLHTGKVRVSIDTKKRTEAVVLTPGKELRYNRKTGASSLLAFNTTGAADVMVKAGTGNQAHVKPDWYKFNNQPMTQVLDQLSNYYGVAIYYYPPDVTDIYFDGKFENTDSLDKILTDLTLPNNLKLIRNDSGFIIKRK